ncbi:MAG: hypothetical protein ABIS38_03785 [Sphingomicrobium sp.]
MDEPRDADAAPYQAGTDEHYAPRPLAGWFIPAAVAALLFFSFGCVLYLMHMMADVGTMPLDQRAAYAAELAWVTGANAINVWIGLVGAVLLLLKKRAAEPVLGVSLLGALAWICGLIGVTQLRETMSATDLLVALVMTALTWTIFWFARHSRQRAWLK